ncbi:mandelate racemase/muconate lactonizing enzyme family protein [Chloroflexi bacterium TSY]|nr:mandelate racemase/muconate lactonizing enzyme family protein [Chloroflexi bacterium TSY]
MKITAVETLVLFSERPYTKQHGMEFAPTEPPVRRVLTDRYHDGRHLCVYPQGEQTVLVRLETDTGLVGWGEAHAPYAPEVTQALILELFVPLILGQDPMMSEVLWEKMYGSMRLRGHNTGFTTEALAGIDIALWDLRGKITEQPVYALLGGPYRTSIPAYASGVPGLRDGEKQISAQKYLDAGYTGVKLAIGRRSLEEDLATIAAVADVLGEQAHLLIDGHGAYDLGTAIQVGRELERLGCYWFEDPLVPEDHSGYVELSRALEIMVVAGETECNRFQFRDRLATRAVDVILPDICRAGGITEGQKIAILADAYQTPWAAHVSMGTMVHVAAALHLGSASPNFLICEFHPGLTALGNDIVKTKLNPENSFLSLPEGPGLGIKFDEEALARATRLRERRTV